jgi:polyphosphate kinase 2 (PPK2 family)
VLGFCSKERVRHFLEMTLLVEKAIVDSAVILRKYWLEVSPEERIRRLEARIDDGQEIWKLTDVDLKSYSHWYDYSSRRPTTPSGSFGWHRSRASRPRIRRTSSPQSILGRADEVIE